MEEACCQKNVIKLQFHRKLFLGVDDMEKRRHVIKKKPASGSRIRLAGGIAGAAVLVLAAAVFLQGRWAASGGQAETGGRENVLETAARAPGISAGAAILMDAGDGTVLYEYNADQKMYPASTTKIMTALVVLELCEELGIGLDGEIIVPAEAEGVEGSSLYLKTGERLTLEELLYGLMLQSGNDAAVALGTAMGGGAETGLVQFVEWMNEKASELGCSGTHFVNPNGLYNEEHYTTARDLARIAQTALQHDEFRRIVSAEGWNSPGGSGRSFTNKNKTVFQYEGGDGVKIGYTKASGRTLVASATRNGRQLIAVVLNDGNWFQDAYALLDYGFGRIGEER